jgi:hypothetical protein
MGTDIHGWIECYTTNTNSDSWIPIADLFPFFRGRNYDAFACLFGVRNYAGFRPIAEDRGLPNDISKKVREKFPVEDGYHSYTWITYLYRGQYTTTALYTNATLTTYPERKNLLHAHIQANHWLPTL